MDKHINDLINDMQSKGLVSFVTCGKSWAVFNFIQVMATTRPMHVTDIKLGVN
jgi:hypothetical protein